MSKKKIIESDTMSIITLTLEGGIMYAHKNESIITGYSTIELIGMDIRCLISPDMPMVIYGNLKDNLDKDITYNLISKNLKKCGGNYWVVSNVTINKDSNGNITNYTAKRKAVPTEIIKEIEPLYKDLLEIENHKGIEASKIYLNSHLKETIGKSYDDYVIYLFEKMENKKALGRFGKTQKKGTLGKTINWFFLSEYEN